MLSPHGLLSIVRAGVWEGFRSKATQLELGSYL